MAGPTANLPHGIFDLLGIKAGNYPNQLVESIRPTLDLWELLSASNALEEVAGSNAFGSGSFSGGFALLPVPQGEIWLVKGFSITAQTGPAEQFVFKPCLLANHNGLVNTPYRSWDVTGVTVATASIYVGTSTGPFFLGPGEAIGLALQTCITAATITATARAYIQRARR